MTAGDGGMGLRRRVAGTEGRHRVLSAAVALSHLAGGTP